jgi:hypothetical protein
MPAFYLSVLLTSQFSVCRTAITRPTKAFWLRKQFANLTRQPSEDPQRPYKMVRRIPRVFNPNYQRNGTKSYVWLMSKCESIPLSPICFAKNP